MRMNIYMVRKRILATKTAIYFSICVLYPEKGVCADPVDKGAILGEGGGGRPPAVTKGVS